jgi:predicted MFS family arabinose efflux permease
MLLYGLIVPVIPEFSARLGANTTSIGILFASYGVALLVATPIFGALSAHVRRRTLLLIGLLGIAASTLGFAMATTFGGLVVARVLQGSAAAATWIAGLSILADRGGSFGIATSASAAGTLLGPPLGGFLADRWGHRAPFVCVGLLVVALALGGLGLAEPTRGRPRAWGVLSNRRVYAICIFVMIAAALLGALEPMLPLDLAKRLHASAGQIGLLFAVATIAFGLASPLAGWAAKRLGATPAMVVGWIGAALTFPLLTLPGSFAVQALAMAAFGVALSMVQGPALRALASEVDRVGGDYGVAYAAYNGAYAIGIMLGASLGSHLPLPPRHFGDAFATGSASHSAGLRDVMASACTPDFISSESAP